MLSFFPRDVLDEILNLIESVSEEFPSYSCLSLQFEESGVQVSISRSETTLLKLSIALLIGVLYL